MRIDARDGHFFSFCVISDGYDGKCVKIKHLCSSIMIRSDNQYTYSEQVKSIQVFSFDRTERIVFSNASER